MKVLLGDIQRRGSRDAITAAQDVRVRRHVGRRVNDQKVCGWSGGRNGRRRHRGNHGPALLSKKRNAIISRFPPPRAASSFCADRFSLWSDAAIFADELLARVLSRAT